MTVAEFKKKYVLSQKAIEYIINNCDGEITIYRPHKNSYRLTYKYHEGEFCRIRVW